MPKDKLNMDGIMEKLLPGSLIGMILFIGLPYKQLHFLR